MAPMAKPTRYWLMKSEPDVYSIDDLKKDGHTLWTGVRNYQARNYMMGDLEDSMKPGDRFIFYHSNAEPSACVGVGQISKVRVADPEQFNKKSDVFEPKSSKDNPRWYCAEVAFVEKFASPVSLETVRLETQLKDMLLIRKGSRLSVQPVTKEEFEHVAKLGRKRLSPKGVSQPGDKP